MSKRSRRLHPDQQKAFEQEQLNRPINPNGEGETQAVKVLLSPEFEQMSNLDATSVALMLQEIIRGQNSLLARIEDTNIEVAKLREHQANVDKQIAETLQRERNEIEDVLDQASKLKLTGEAKDRVVAKGAKMYTEALVSARARSASDKLRFEEQLKNMPKENVLSPGSWIQTREGMKLIPEEVRIKHKIWLLPPGVPIEVPKAVADVLRDRRKSQLETAKRKELLGKQVEQTKMAEEWAKIDGSKVQSMPLA
jgi:hypothetical protein